jgi:hypothetical protein
MIRLIFARLEVPQSRDQLQRVSCVTDNQVEGRKSPRRPIGALADLKVTLYTLQTRRAYRTATGTEICHDISKLITRDFP